MTVLRVMSRRDLMKGASALAVASAARPMAAPRAAPSDPRIEHWLRTRSIEKKAGQLSIYGDPARTNGPALDPRLVRDSMESLKTATAAGTMTGLYNGIGVLAGRELQKTAIEQSRYGIPLIFAGDVIHGVKTTFPVPSTEAASFDPDLARRTARAAAVEASAKGIHWVFAPTVDIARNKRWHRVVEGAGKDIWLGRQFAAALVRGFQSDDLKAEDSVLACPKHFAGYGAVAGGMEYSTADIPETTLRETHLPPFRASFDANALSTTASFMRSAACLRSSAGGVPATFMLL